MKYIYKKRWGGIQETEDFSDIKDIEYRVSVDKSEYEKIQMQLQQLEILKIELDEKNNLINKNDIRNNELSKKIQEFEKSNRTDKNKIESYKVDLETIREKLERLNNNSSDEIITLNSLKDDFNNYFLNLKKEKNFGGVHQKIDDMFLILENNESSKESCLDGLFEIFKEMRDLGVRCNDLRLKEIKQTTEKSNEFEIDIYLLKKEIEELKNNQIDFEIENNYLKHELEQVQDESELELELKKAERKILNQNEIIDRKQSNIRKLKLELEKIKSKKSKTKLKDITLDDDGDSFYEGYRSKVINTIKHVENYEERRYFTLKFDDNTDIEEVIEYIKLENLEKNNLKLFNLLHNSDTVLWKIQTKNGMWQIILLKK